MLYNSSRFTTHLFRAIPLVTFSLLTSSSFTIAQTVNHGSHHHLMVGRDNLQTLATGDYAGMINPNYNRLTLLFPHQHEPIETSGFHPIGIYSYSGPINNPIINSTSTNNQIPETRSNLPPLPLFPGTGIFSEQMVNKATDENIYSDLKTRPLAHLVEDLSEPYVYAIYNAGNGRWNGLLGEEATISLELLNITEGLNVVNDLGEILFDQVGDRYIIGQGDFFTFYPIFTTAQSNTTQTYSATFSLVDVNDNNRTPWLSSGSFTFNFQAEPVPEPSNLLTLGIIALFGLVNLRKVS